ncbi:MAG: hypothetical protein ACFFDW_13530 [Candidatus Thorarchaeota archaeon]
MPIEMEYLPVAFIIALGFAAMVGVIAVLATILGRIFRRKSKEEDQKKPSMKMVFVRTYGEHLDRLFLISVYLAVFESLAIFLLLPFSAFVDEFNLKDIWPFMLFVSVLLFTFLTVVDWSKLRTKRTTQRDMRRY